MGVTKRFRICTTPGAKGGTAPAIASRGACHCNTPAPAIASPGACHCKPRRLPLQASGACHYKPPAPAIASRPSLESTHATPGAGPGSRPHTQWSGAVLRRPCPRDMQPFFGPFGTKVPCYAAAERKCSESEVHAPMYYVLLFYYLKVSTEAPEQGYRSIALLPECVGRGVV